MQFRWLASSLVVGVVGLLSIATSVEVSTLAPVQVDMKTVQMYNADDANPTNVHSTEPAPLPVNGTALSAPLPFTPPPANASAFLTNASGVIARMKHNLVFPSRDTAWQAVCGGVQTAPGPVEDGFTIGVTTYKGHATLAHTVESWKRSGLATHRALKEVLFHVNRCSVEDIVHIERITASLAARVRVLCSEDNLVHPLALLRLVAYTTTALVLLTENDRPSLPRRGEAPREHAHRVQWFLDASLQALKKVPMVFLERGPMASDDAAYIAYSKKIARKRPLGRSAYTTQERHARFVRDGMGGMDWPKGSCWETCFLFASYTAVERQEALYECKVQEEDAVGDVNGRSANLWGSCAWRTCREWRHWARGHAGVGFVCPAVWHRAGLHAGMAPRMVKKASAAAPGSTLMCATQQGWSNGPALMRLTWYRDTIVRDLCTKINAKKSGLVPRASRAWFGWYGRAMEVCC